MGLLYHASNVPGIEIPEPRVSNHGVSYVYFSRKRENVLVYLGNAIEKYCKETGFVYTGSWKKWGPYGFNAYGIRPQPIIRSTGTFLWENLIGFPFRTNSKVKGLSEQLEGPFLDAEEL